jgi:desulfoferrodoxin (superoxide reductase-like protein)
MKNVKNRRLLILVTAFCLFLASPALAHPPSDIQMKYDNLTQVLSITILHNVKDPADHYIKSLSIKANEDVLVTLDYTKQQDKEKQEETFTFSKICKGSKITVTAVCNKFGKMERSFEIN